MTDISTRILKSEPAAIAQAARILAHGGLVAFPTETVYGLGADATQGEAVARLYAAKRRPAFNPLIAHVADANAASALVCFDATATTLAAAFWPGPLTLVLPKAFGCPVSDLACAGLDTLAVRVPDHPIAHALLKAFGRPVVAPSANRSGHVSPTTAEHVLADLSGRVDLVLDAGATRVGVESTIVACLEGEVTLLRPGGFARGDIEAALGRPLSESRSERDPQAPLAPGMLASHYAPRAALRLNAAEVRPGEALLAFGPTLPAGGPGVMTLNLSAQGDLIEAAANLFSHLRALDASGTVHVAVMPVPNMGLGEAVNDRLTRAAAPR